AKVEIKSKEAKAKAAMAGSKGRRKKWNKGKTRERLNNAVLFDEENYQKLLKEVPKMKVITVANVSERLKITGSLARAAINELVSQGKVRSVVHHSSMLVYTRATK
ncbi:rps25, partial [Symbiodinium sp. KB8]